MECSCYLRNVHDSMADGRTTVERRLCEKFDGPSVLFGTLVELYERARLVRRVTYSGL